MTAKVVISRIDISRTDRGAEAPETLYCGEVRVKVEPETPSSMPDVEFLVPFEDMPGLDAAIARALLELGNYAEDLRQAVEEARGRHGLTEPKTE